MLREFLRKIFSPPNAIEERRVQKEDFARLKRRVREEEPEAAEEVCDVEHGPLSLHHAQHTPLSRSVSIHASQAAYEHYLRRNAAKADNWAAFDDILNPKIEPLDADAKPASFLSPEEEAELANRIPTAPAPPIQPYLKNHPKIQTDVWLTTPLVKMVEKIVSKNATSAGYEYLTDHLQLSPHNNVYAKKKLRTLEHSLAIRYCKIWLRRQAANEDTEPEILRHLSSSTMPAVRAAVAGNERIPYDCLWSLAHDAEAKVRMHLAKNPNCTIELLDTLGRDTDEKVAKKAKSILVSITG